MPHLIETYALACGAKIKKPFIFEKFFPLAVEKYITLQPFSKYNSKCYDLWQDVLDELSPLLSKEGISIIQIGGKNEKVLRGVYSAAGQTNINQAAYIISKGILHLGVDSFAAHIASGYGKKIVCLYSNNYAQIVRPYWGDKKNHILLEPDRSEHKPSFSAEENPKTINEITSESIVNEVCKLLNIDYKSKYKTAAIGPTYFNRFIETLPNQILNIQEFGVDSFVIRMDFLFNESILAQQLQLCKCSIVTDKPINKDILKAYRHNIKDFIYNIDDGGNPEFLNTLAELNLNYFLMASVTGDKLNEIKLNYLDLGNINTKGNHKENRDSLNKLNKKLYYKSSKFTLSEGKIYTSHAALLDNKPVDSFDPPPQEVIDNDLFWKEFEHFKILVDF